MSVVLTFTVPGGQFALGRAMPEGGIRAELDRVVPLGNRTPPLLWAYADERALDAYEGRLGEDADVADVSVVDAFEDRRLYRIDWTEPPRGVFAHLEAASASLTGASGDREEWEFSARFPTQDALSEFHDACRDDGIDLSVTSLSRFDPSGERAYGLTANQRETLVRAYDAGFYEIPRDITTVDLATDIGISDQSLSERLRRAHAALVEGTLL
ncbi:helix-turn-helix domain-containing protein [Halarchaeum sp. CBA1220]|uniref:helix-turn-helix domain-containing protein n=1 Tax=Halarchaeum sp. CBA1220 TaxID=1853682 RepID=UPI000F3A9ADF|nr:helix-turn-helix domain-containing protein [Halarchaeum sp. CBA1220]QLC32831.1 helix-turn-helix domain-containing protein [Halarchaeum sp. CBA1220]